MRTHRCDTQWADTRIRGTTTRQVAAMFAEEQPALQPLPHSSRFAITASGASTYARHAGGIASTTPTARPARRRTLAVLSAAHHAGVSIGAVCDDIHQHEGASGIRRMLGVLALTKNYGPVVVDDAAKAARDLGVPTYRFVRRYLERRLPVTLGQVDPHLQADAYQITRQRAARRWLPTL
jgi:hypothetical protein